MPQEDAGRYYSGDRSYTYAEPLLRKGRDLCIVSPYIDRYYANFIRNISQDRRIRIISSSIDWEARALLERKSNTGMLIVAAMALISANYLLYEGAYPPAVLALSALLTVAILALLLAGHVSGSLQKNRNIILKVPKTFIHAKLYISENAAMTGSANLTYRGMHKNIEQIEIIRSEEGIRRLRQEFMRLWDSC